jgi:hypothetical protein
VLAGVQREIVAAQARDHAVRRPGCRPGFTHQTALIAEPARQPRASVLKWALMSALMKL